MISRWTIGNCIHDHPRGDCIVIERIDDDKAARGSILLIRVAKDRAVQVELDLADFVKLQAVGVAACRKY